MMLATSTLWSVPGGSSVMPANEKSPLHGLLIAPQAVQPASIRSVGAAVLGVPIAIAPTFIGHFRDDGYDFHNNPSLFWYLG